MDGFDSLALFSQLDASELAEVESLARPFEVRARDLIFRQGDEADGMYVISSGRVRVSTRLLGEEDVELLTMGPGEILGELSLLDRGVRSASAAAVEATSGYFFGNRNFEVLRAGFRPAAFKVMQHINAVLCRRIRDVCGEIGELEHSIMPPSMRSPNTNVRASQRHDERESIPPRIDSLRAIPLFRQFTEAELQELLGHARVRDMPSGQVLIEQGARSTDACFLVARGAVQKFVQRAMRSENLGVLGPGKIFGQVAMLDGLPQPGSFRVRERSDIIEIQRTAFERLCGGGSTLAFKFSDCVTLSLVEMLRSTTRQLGRLLAEGSVRRARGSVLQSEVETE